MSKSASELADDVLEEIQSLQQELNDPEYEQIYEQSEIIENIENEMLSVSTVKSSREDAVNVNDSLEDILNGMNKQLKLIGKELATMKIKQREDVLILNRKIETNTLPESALLLAADWDASERNKSKINVNKKSSSNNNKNRKNNKKDKNSSSSESENIANRRQVHIERNRRITDKFFNKNDSLPISNV